MSDTTFTARLDAVQRKKRSRVCVGLDPDPSRLPAHLLSAYALPDAVISFNRAIISATADVACAFKLNLAFFEALGRDGWRALEETLAEIPNGVLTVADGKRGDIGNSARFYAQSTFAQLGFDACTVSGYMGRDSVTPFLDFEGRGVFLLARTSNPGGSDFQELNVDGRPLFEHVVEGSATWSPNHPGSLGFVVGATDIDALRRIRQLAPSAPLLIPGIGAQGGDVRAVLNAAAAGNGPILVNSSRSIIYASEGENFAQAAADAAERLRAELNGA